MYQVPEGRTVSGTWMHRRFRTYERPALRLRRLRAQVRKAEREVQGARRQMRLWVSAIELPPAARKR